MKFRQFCREYAILLCIIFWPNLFRRLTSRGATNVKARLRSNHRTPSLPDQQPNRSSHSIANLRRLKNFLHHGWQPQKPLVRPMFGAGSQFPDRLEIAAQLVGDRYTRLSELREELCQKSRCRPGISAGLHENVERPAIGIHRPPQPDIFPADHHAALGEKIHDVGRVLKAKR